MNSVNKSTRFLLYQSRLFTSLTVNTIAKSENHELINKMVHVHKALYLTWMSRLGTQHIIPHSWLQALGVIADTKNILCALG